MTYLVGFYIFHDNFIFVALFFIYGKDNAFFKITGAKIKENGRKISGDAGITRKVL
jgi:hypothetical protein